MKTVVKLNKWANLHTYIVIDTLRVMTGLFLIIKGIQFANQSQYLENIIDHIHDIKAVKYICARPAV